MDLDPHTLHLILEKIKQQLACPQCSARIELDDETMRMCGDTFMVFQMQCPACEAHVVLHATVAGVEPIRMQPHTQKNELQTGRNISSSIHLESEEIQMLRESLQQSNGSFSTIFNT